MTIDWANFTPWASLAGGAMIGLSAALFVLLNGRIAGISGVLGGLFSRAREGVAQRLLFVLGLCWRRCSGNCSANFRRLSSPSAGKGYWRQACW